MESWELVTVNVRTRLSVCRLGLVNRAFLISKGVPPIQIHGSAPGVDNLEDTDVSA